MIFEPLFAGFLVPCLCFLTLARACLSSSVMFCLEVMVEVQNSLMILVKVRFSG